MGGVAGGWALSGRGTGEHGVGLEARDGRQEATRQHIAQTGQQVRPTRPECLKRTHTFVPTKGWVGSEVSTATAKIMERRLQTKVFKLGLAKSIHHARCLIRQRHIRVGKQICDIPSFLVRLDSEKHIDFAVTSPFGGGPAGRVRRKRAAAKGGGDAGGDEDED